MPAVTRRGSASVIARLATKKWWYMISFLLPLVIAFGGAVYLANRLGEYRGETEKLALAAAAAEGRRALAEDKVLKLSERVTELEAQRAKAETEVATLNAKIADLQFQEGALTTSASPPDPSAIISRVRAELARPRDRSYALVREGERAVNHRHLDVAKTLYDAAAREDPTYAAPLIALGFMAVNRGDMGEAERKYRAARVADPTDPYALTALVNLYMGEKRFDDAREVAGTLRGMPKLPPAAEIALSKVPPA